jgi:SAM-dependent methyltransferase
VMNKTKLRDNLRETYNKYAQERETLAMHDWKIDLRSNFLSLLQKEQKKTLLEIGAGTGRDSKFFQDQGLDVVCIDLSPVMVDLCKQKGLTAYVMDMAEAHFPAGSFDAVYSMNSLLHLTKAEFPVVLRNIDRLLKTDGVVFIGMYGGLEHEGVWENDSYDPKRFFSFFTDEHLKQEITKVFDIISLESIHPQPEDNLDFQRLLLRKKIPGESSRDLPTQ